jgi:pSer/pThr/pTyr-binding forkhead associated (FHA) protein
MIATLVSIEFDRRIELDQDSMIVGGNEWRVDIHLPEDDVADVHCELRNESGTLKIIDLSETGVVVNGENVRVATLQDGDEIRIGCVEFQLEIPLASPISQEIEVDNDSEVTFESTNNGLDSSREQNKGEVEPVNLDSDYSLLGKSQISSVEDDDADVLLAGELDGRSDSEEEIAFATITPRGVREQALQDVPVPLPLVSSYAPVAPKTDLIDLEEESAQPIEQFFVVLAEREVGPVPFSAIQELAHNGDVKPLSPMRREIEKAWSTAQVYEVRFVDPDDDTFEVPEDHPTNSRLRGRPQLSPHSDSGDSSKDSNEADLGSAKKTEPPCPAGSTVTKKRGVLGTAMWFVVAPWYYVSTAISAVLSLKPQYIAVVVGVVGVGCYFSLGWMKGLTQTALTGQVKMDGKGIGNAILTVSGLTTGESAAGVTDSDGDFRLVTLHGKLKPGKYHVIVQPADSAGTHSSPGDLNSDQSQASDPDQIKIPFKYQSITTTDLTIEITPESEYVEIELSHKRRRRGYR